MRCEDGVVPANLTLPLTIAGLTGMFTKPVACVGNPYCTCAIKGEYKRKSYKGGCPDVSKCCTYLVILKCHTLIGLADPSIAFTGKAPKLPRFVAPEDGSSVKS